MRVSPAPAPADCQAGGVGVEIRVASRRSPLARRQAELFALALVAAEPGAEVRYVAVETEGDIRQDVALSRLGGKGVFTQEIEGMLRRGEADVAVHSLKDLPTALAPGLCIAALLPREDPRDALVASEGLTLEGLPYGARVGTSSPRRRAQLLHLRPDLKVLDLRGNVGTRLQRLAEGQYDALVMAAAGLLRAGHQTAIAQYLDPETMLGAPAQGIIAIEAAEDRQDLLPLLRRLSHRLTERLALCERTLLMELGSGCSVPVGALGRRLGRALSLTAGVFAPDGSTAMRITLEGTKAEELGRRVARELLLGGAGRILGEAASDGR